MTRPDESPVPQTAALVRPDAAEGDSSCPPTPADPLQLGAWRAPVVPSATQPPPQASDRHGWVVLASFAAVALAGVGLVYALGRLDPAAAGPPADGAVSRTVAGATGRAATPALVRSSGPRQAAPTGGGVDTSVAATGTWSRTTSPATSTPPGTGTAPAVVPAPAPTGSGPTTLVGVPAPIGPPVTVVSTSDLTQRGTGQVQVDPGGYLGTAWQDVARQLRDHGLAVRVQHVRSSRPPGTVVAVLPTGLLPLRSTVTLLVATAG